MAESNVHNDSDSASAEERDPFALLRTSHPRLANVTKENLWKHMPHLAAWLRCYETQQEDAIFQDPFADALARECGAAMIRIFPEFASRVDSRNYVALRTFVMDEAMRRHDPAIKQIVMLGAGMNTHAFRLDELADCTVFEVQLDQDVMLYKEEVLQSLDAKPKALQRIVLQAELSDDSWQTALQDVGFDVHTPTFWMIESTLQFFQPGEIIHILEGIDKLSAPQSQLMTERIAGVMDVDVDEDNRVELLIHTEMRYGEDGSVFRGFPWTVELLMRRNQACDYYGTLWDAERFARLVVDPKEAFAGAWFLPLFFKPA